MVDGAFPSLANLGPTPKLSSLKMALITFRVYQEDVMFPVDIVSESVAHMTLQFGCAMMQVSWYLLYFFPANIF